MQEIIKPISGYPNYYVTNEGTVLANFTTGRRPLKPRKNNRGYLRVRISCYGKPKELLVHRLVAEAFLPNPDGLGTVNHIDCDKTNNRVENLEWCDLLENIEKYYLTNKR